jgi:hypothetical protein
MKLTLARKADSSDRGPMLVQYVDGPDDKLVKRTLTVGIGQTLELPDDIASQLLSRYPKCFVIGQDAKSKSAYADKSLA